MHFQSTLETSPRRLPLSAVVAIALLGILTIAAGLAATLIGARPV